MRAIDENGLDEEIRCEMCRNPMKTDRGCDGNCKYDEKLYEKIMQILDERIKPLPSAQPERLTDDDFETIRIHLNAYKEKLCNQQRWEEAKEYQYIIDRFMAFASAQPEEVIPHRNYKYLSDYWCECGWHLGKKGEVKYCSECGRKVNWDG